MGDFMPDGLAKKLRNGFIFKACSIHPQRKIWELVGKNEDIGPNIKTIVILE